MHPEILAPAGDETTLRAALAAGADAVYFGLDEGLNARARATNLSAERLPALVDAVHRANARAYLTVNVVVFQEELPAVERIVRLAAEAGVDALIVQDPAVALLARAVAPSLHIHASTQMTVSSAEGLAFARDLGVVRVVLPRELSVAEIGKLRQQSDMPLEVFVHGALCMSWSGQCLTSEAWGGRSANRGQCAQACRLPYTLVVDDQPRDTQDVKYLLSPLDLAGVRALPALVEAGVCSLKIEGRLKGPAYVVTAVEGYRRWRQAVLDGAHTSEQAVATLQNDLSRMATTFSRGFSDGFLAGSDHQDLVEGRFPKHRGRLLGRVVEARGDSVRIVWDTRNPSGGVALGEGYRPDGTVQSPLPAVGGANPDDSRGVPAPVDPPTAGCGVGFDTGHPEASEPGGTLWRVDPTPDGAWLRFGPQGPDLRGIHDGHKVWLTRDARVERDTERLLADGEPEGRIPVDLVVSGAPGEPLVVVWTAGSASVTVRSAPAGEAQGAGLDAAMLRDKLGALGGTPFRLGALRVDLRGRVHLSPGALKSLRREAVPALLDGWLASFRHRTVAEADASTVIAASHAIHALRSWSPDPEPVLLPLCRTDAQLDAALDAGLREVELDWMEVVGLQRAVARARQAGARVTIATVRVQKPGEEPYDRRIDGLRPDGVLVRHWGGLMHFARVDGEGPLVHGDFSLNVTNAVTAHHLLAKGLHTLTAAHDLDEAQLFALLADFPAERVVVAAHHHIAAFHMEHCVYAHALSHGRDFRSCGRPCEAHRVALRDPKGQDHPVVVDVACRNTLFNAQAQTAARVLPRLLQAGVRRFRVEFVWETGAQARSVLLAYQDLLAGRATAEQVLPRIAAHEQFGVTAGTMRTLGQRGSPSGAPCA